MLTGRQSRGALDVDGQLISVMEHSMNYERNKQKTEVLGNLEDGSH